MPTRIRFWFHIPTIPLEIGWKRVKSLIETPGSWVGHGAYGEAPSTSVLSYATHLQSRVIAFGPSHSTAFIVPSPVRQSKYLFPFPKPIPVGGPSCPAFSSSSPRSIFIRSVYTTLDAAHIAATDPHATVPVVNAAIWIIRIDFSEFDFRQNHPC